MTQGIAKSIEQESPSATSIQVSCSILGSWKFWLTLTAIAMIAGAAFNWSWLVGAGIAPLVVAVLPCVAMCALGLCMAKRSAEDGCHGNGQKPSTSSLADQNVPTRRE